MNFTDNQTINSIKEKYKYTIDYSKDLQDPESIMFGLFGAIIKTIKGYHFKEKIEKIKETLKNQKNNKSKDFIEFYSKEIEKIEKNIENTLKKIDDMNMFYLNYVEYYLENDYNHYKDKYKIDGIYKKVIEGAVEELSKKNIEFEKLLVSYNDNIKDIFILLNINF